MAIPKTLAEFKAEAKANGGMASLMCNGQWLYCSYACYGEMFGPMKDHYKYTYGKNEVDKATAEEILLSRPEKNRAS